MPHKHRERRSTPSSAIETYDTCQLALVADYLFFEHMGQGKSSTAINYIVSMLVNISCTCKMFVFGFLFWLGQMYLTICCVYVFRYQIFRYQNYKESETDGKFLLLISNNNLLIFYDLLHRAVTHSL